MTMHLDRVKCTEDLPEEWDRLAADYYQKKAFLRHCQEYNPCRQRYYLLSEDGNLVAGAVVYSLRLDLFTYLGMKSPVMTQIVGLPCSVSSSSLVGAFVFHEPLLRRMLNYERGLIACLNLDTLPRDLPMAVGRTWPDIAMTRPFDSWDQYVDRLRSPYRRRLRQVEQDAAQFAIQTESCTSFTEEMHAQYVNVFSRSQGKLEKLELAFFRNLPGGFSLTTYRAEGALRGWTITLNDGERFYFFLGGQDYRYDPKGLYLVKLMTMLKQGITSGAALIDLGQSAEIPKMRLGGTPREKIMLAYHSQPLVNRVLRATIGLLSYRGHFPDTRVFKEGVL